jgi:hypothetical protein
MNRKNESCRTSFTPVIGESSGQTGADSPANNYREGIRGDGFRGSSPPEIVEKLPRMTESQREQMILHIEEIREKSSASAIARSLRVFAWDNKCRGRDIYCPREGRFNLQ